MSKDKVIQKKMITNTAYLLNMWFQENTTWTDVREFLNSAWEGHWKGENDGVVEITFKIKQKVKQQ